VIKWQMLLRLDRLDLVFRQLANVRA